MERGSDKHSPLVDDQLKHETEGLVRGGGHTHAEEWADPEPSGEDQPQADLAPDGELVGGTPPGMDPADVTGRSELARFLGGHVYPAVRERLVEVARDNGAPEVILDRLRSVPAGREFANVSEVWTALGGHVEEQRI